MTREEAIDLAIDEHACKYAEEFVDKIYNEHEAHVNDLRNAIDRYMEEAAMYKSILDKAKAQLKAKESDLGRQDMIIKCLNIDLDNKEKLLKAKDEEIELLKCRIEEAMKHKTCEGCKQSWEPNNQTFHKYFCEYLKIPVHGGFYCNRYEPKDNS